MTIYVDVIFIENLLLNFIILCATAVIGKGKIHIFKFLLSSSFGSLYAILNYIINLNTFENFLLKLFISSFMILISFDNKKLKVFFKNLVMFYLTSFTFGGVAFMLLFFISPENVIYENGHFIGTYPIKITIIGGVLGFLIIALVAKFIKDRIQNTLCDLEIAFKGKIIHIKTLIDSGNLLKEPITNQDVIVVQKSSLEELIDKKILNEAIAMVNGKFIGDMSMGLRHGRVYDVKVYSESGRIIVDWGFNRCPYYSPDAFSANWSMVAGWRDRKKDCNGRIEDEV